MLAFLRASRVVRSLEQAHDVDTAIRPVFSNGETEAQRGELTHQSHTASMEVEEKPGCWGWGRWLPRRVSWLSRCPERNKGEGLEEESGSSRRQRVAQPEEAGQACSSAREGLGSKSRHWMVWASPLASLSLLLGKTGPDLLPHRETVRTRHSHSPGTERGCTRYSGEQ